MLFYYVWSWNYIMHMLDSLIETQKKPLGKNYPSLLSNFLADWDVLYVATVPRKWWKYGMTLVWGIAFQSRLGEVIWSI